MSATEPSEYRQVYFIEAEGRRMVKIGHADNAKRRLAQLQVGTADRLALRGVFHTDDARRLERQLHERFAGQRVRGEWFRITKAIRELFDPDMDKGYAIIPICFNPDPHRKPEVALYRQPKDTDETFIARCCDVLEALGHEVIRDAA